MNVTLRPELERFIADQVNAGRYSSAAEAVEAVEAGVTRLMLDPEPDARDLADLRESLGQMARGETIDARLLHAQLRR